MKHLLIAFLTMFTATILTTVTVSHAADGFEEPTNACYQGCTPWMSELLLKFETRGEQLKREPAFYSGECRHLGDFDPEHVHYASVMIDQLPAAGEFYFSTMFTYFSAGNDYASWDLEKARQEMSPYWKENGHMTQGSKSSRVVIPFEDGSPAYIYWLRQDPATDTLYYITYVGVWQRSFCELRRH